MIRNRAATPLFLQALGLVLATLLAAWLTSAAVVALLPPPVTDLYRMSDLSEALRTGQNRPAAEGRLLIVSVRDRPARQNDGNGRANWVRSALSERLAVNENRIAVSNNRPQVGPIRTFGPSVRESREAREKREDRERQRRRDLGEPFLMGDFELSMQRDDGRYTVVTPQHTFRLNSWQGRILLIYGLAVLVVSPLAWLFARRMTAPIAAFAKAAERLGRDPRAPPLDLKGSTEVNDAVIAFNQMQNRLSRYVEDRTAMIAAIAHDLRTPLTRLRFRIEAAPEDARAKLAADIDQMDEMISAALNFVRDATQTGERVKLELSSLLETVVDEAAEIGTPASLTASEKVVIEGDSLSLRRLIANLIDNAVKYGGVARASLRAEPDFAVIEIEDDGPGVDSEEIERLFEPFYRREPSRSRETGGIGLGLAVVRSIARAHGGDVTLHNRPQGGLLARVMLPR
jgi:two-component system OmpR family sensor kinase